MLFRVLFTLGFIALFWKYTHFQIVQLAPYKTGLTACSLLALILDGFIGWFLAGKFVKTSSEETTSRIIDAEVVSEEIKDADPAPALPDPVSEMRALLSTRRAMIELKAEMLELDRLEKSLRPRRKASPKRGE